MTKRKSASGPAAAAAVAGNVGGLAVSLAIVVVWYAASFFTDAFNKQIQQAKRLPVTVTFVQFLSGGLWSSVILRGAKLRPFIPLRKDQAKPLLPIALCWYIGFLTTNLSLGRTAVSFTHAIKATEPVFLVVIATFFFHQTFSNQVWVSLIPICLGIVLVALTELDFSTLGLVSAVTANCCFVLRSIFAKRILQSKLVDNFNLFYYISWAAAILTAPLVVFMEGAQLVEGVRTGELVPLLGLIVMNGTLHYVYNQASMLLLARVPALTHSIGR
ncbi:hypothetical protein PTSG_08907 [Salpingoeca rosetta]|uniref:Sugar phosphate transporter domain-containing protein n=1 Tax=Salpingoeca rosetta (strain ATCC 50818 / BSB-021) TaxID=946362 RepID=F2UL18_SALR5|nr:uncharacterized protein PTSG_08907 [Salpingoeca rosetta]EGD77817.1 hypothetical protein PTSG_08907 [Salpingoeca rosetta]|eukprot:XP_004990293.1 hypothetical protein PTSG_08907 [Salpingoeca rosetta]